MDRIMGVTEARSRFGEIVDEVQYQGDTVVLEKNGKPAAALISMSMFERFIKNREAAYQVVLEVQKQNEDLEMTEEELLKFVNEVTHEMRAKNNQSAK